MRADSPFWDSPLPSSTQHPPRNQGSVALGLHTTFLQWHQAARGPGPFRAWPQQGLHPKDAVTEQICFVFFF